MNEYIETIILVLKIVTSGLILAGFLLLFHIWRSSKPTSLSDRKFTVEEIEQLVADIVKETQAKEDAFSRTNPGQQVYSLDTYRFIRTAARKVLLERNFLS